VIALDRVDGELSKLWEAAGRRTPTRTMTVVALCETPGHVPIAEQAVAYAAPRHGARSLVVAFDAAGSGVDADVALHTSQKGVPCAELIRLTAHGDARTFVPDAVARLLAPDLPVLVWWVGDLPDHEVLLDRVTQIARATIAIVDANAMDLRDLPVLDALARRDRNVAIADFCWQRLRTWQDMMARFFDNDAAVIDLSSPKSLRIEFQQRARDPERASNQAALFAGWLSARLGGNFPVEYVPVKREGLVEGSLVDVVLRAGEGCYRVHRAPEEASVVCWEGERPGVPFPNQCVRTQIPDDGTLLDRVLTRPLRDPLYETSLTTAAAIAKGLA
jgi:glucose-6-phosphate dehydrogenase assembly protein OpcA